MSSDKVMVHAATGASPPRLPVSKQDVGCSPINIRSSTQSTAELGKGFDPSSILLNQDEQNIMMKKYVFFIIFLISSRKTFLSTFRFHLKINQTGIDGEFVI